MSSADKIAAARVIEAAEAIVAASIIDLDEQGIASVARVPARLVAVLVECLNKLEKNRT